MAASTVTSTVMASTVMASTVMTSTVMTSTVMASTGGCGLRDGGDQREAGEASEAA